MQTCEAVAFGVARDAGLTVPDIDLVRLDDDHAVLISGRFDRTERGRIGYQSMRTTAELEEFEGFSYTTAAGTARYVAGDEAVRGVVGAAALAICVHSIDDHAKNLGFLGDAGTWRLAPLFDIVPFPDEQNGTPLDGSSPGRSLEQLLDIDWGLPRSQVLRMTTRIAQVARGAWDRAPRGYGLDPEAAEACRRFIESACDFDTVLDGREPRFAS